MKYALIIIFGVMNSDYVSTTTERLGPYATWDACVKAREQAIITHTRSTSKSGWRKIFYIVSGAMCVQEPASE